MIELPNTAPGVGQYNIEAGDIFAATRGIPDQTVAIWHTHPGGLIGPSTGDMNNRPGLEIPMLVVALTPDGPIPSWF